MGVPLAVIEVCLCAVLVVNGYSSDKRIETDLHLDTARSGAQADNGYQSDKRTCADSFASIRLSVLPRRGVNGEQADNGHQSDKRTRADSSASIRLSVLPAGHPLKTSVGYLAHASFVYSILIR